MLDIYEISRSSSNKQLIASVEEKELFILNKVFLEYEKKTGYKIDEYGDLVIKNENLKILLDIFKLFLNYKKENFFILNKYYNLLKEIYNKKANVGFFGD